MRSWPGVQTAIVEPRSLHAHDTAHVPFEPSHLVGRASGASHRHGRQKRFHHPPAFVLSHDASDLTTLPPLFAVHAHHAGYAERRGARHVYLRLAPSRPTEAGTPHAYCPGGWACGFGLREGRLHRGGRVLSAGEPAAMYRSVRLR